MHLRARRYPQVTAALVISPMRLLLLLLDTLLPLLLLHATLVEAGRCACLPAGVAVHLPAESDVDCTNYTQHANCAHFITYQHVVPYIQPAPCTLPPSASPAG